MEGSAGQRAPGRRPSRREQLRLAGAFALGALCVLFAVLNLDPVRVNWIVGTWDTPLIVVIFLFTAIGTALGLALPRLTARRRHRRGHLP